MTTRKTTRKAVPVTRARTASKAVLKDLSLQLLTPEQFEAITKANYYHAESRLVLQLFLHVNYSWQLARKIQNDSSSARSIDWALLEKNAAKLIAESLPKLLPGVDRSSWTDPTLASSPSKPARKTTTLVKQACGCRYKHSDAAGVVEACQLGRAQGADESWTGY